MRQIKGRAIPITRYGTITEVFEGPDFPGLNWTRLDVEWDNGETETIFKDEASPIDEQKDNE